MTRIKLKHVDRFVDRFGKARYYFRRGKGRRTSLPGAPGSREFMEAYQAQLEQQSSTTYKARGVAGTFDKLAQDYYASADYLRLADSTRRTYKSVIDRMLLEDKIGHRLVKEMTRAHVRQLIAKRADTPGAANSLLQKIKVLLHFAIDNDWRKDDPTLRVKKFAKGEFHTWTEDEIAQFEARWPIGSTPRLAFALLLYTGQRRSDVVAMCPDDIENGTIQVTPLKTKRTTGKKLWIPIHPDLEQVLAGSKIGSQKLLETSFGKPFKGDGFGNYMADKIDDAGLPQRCVTHGLRKAAARRLAEAGCSANEIQAITGHTTLQEVTRYTKAAEQKKLAVAAMKRLAKRAPNGTVAEGRRDPNSQTSFGSLGIISKNSTNTIGEGQGWWSRGESNP